MLKKERKKVWNVITNFASTLYISKFSTSFAFKNAYIYSYKVGFLVLAMSQ